MPKTPDTAPDAAEPIALPPEPAPAIAALPADDGKKSIEEHAKALGTDAFTLAGAKTLAGWGAGRRLTQPEYEQGLADFLGIKLHSGPAVRIS